MAKPFKPPARIVAGLGGVRYTDTMPQQAFESYVRKQSKGLIDNFVAWTEHMEEQAADVLMEALQPTFDKSQELVPKDTGDLQRSGYLEKGRVAGRPTVEIGYARGGVPHYAVLQHENLEFYHDPPTSAKFLERPLLEDSNNIQKRIVAGFKRASSV